MKRFPLLVLCALAGMVVAASALELHPPAIVLPLAASHGGTGLDTSASSGIPSINAGAWVVNNALTATQVLLGGAGNTVTSSAGFTFVSGSLTLANLTTIQWAGAGGPSITGNASSGAIVFDSANAGFLTIGTTVTTGASIDDVILRNARNVRSVNAAGTNTLSLIGLNASNVVTLGGGATDIEWGPALVALGGGVAPTFGTIGGSGPATAAQDSWMRVLASDGTARWLPAWK